MKLFAFGHQKNVGKDSAAKFLITHLKVNKKISNVKKAGFADKLKQQCYELYSWAGLMPGPWYEEPGNYEKKNEYLPLIGMTPRRIWINHGNAIRNNVYEYAWTDYLLKNSNCDVLIISDMRFPSEAERIRQLGGKVIKITRPSIPHSPDEADDPLLTYTGWDSVLVNDGDLSKLYKTVTDWYEGNS